MGHVINVVTLTLDFVGCRRQNDPQWDITWGNTPPGETDRQRCPVGNGKSIQNNVNFVLR